MIVDKSPEDSLDLVLHARIFGPGLAIVRAKQGVRRHSRWGRIEDLPRVNGKVDEAIFLWRVILPGGEDQAIALRENP